MLIYIRFFIRRTNSPPMLLERRSIIMRVFSLSFSARQSGNCSKLLHYCLSQPPMRQMEQVHCNAFDLAISPCQGCNYECFLESGFCPLIDTDDVALLYRKWAQSDLALFAIPVYGGNLIESAEVRGRLDTWVKRIATRIAL